MRALILVFGIVGTVLFGSAFVLSFSSPLLVENLGKEIIRIEIEHRLGTQLDKLDRLAHGGLGPEGAGQDR